LADVEVYDERFDKVLNTHQVMRKRAHGFVFVEGPVWHAERERLIFSDIPTSRLYEFDPTTDEVELYRFPSNMTNGNVFDQSTGCCRASTRPAASCARRQMEC
jgi:gluconolactonase